MELTNKTTFYIPSRLVRRLSDIIDTITKEVGGVTFVDARGRWINDEGEVVHDPIMLVSWWHGGGVCTDQFTVLINMLLAHENTVMVERSISGVKHYATLYTGE